MLTLKLKSLTSMDLPGLDDHPVDPGLVSISVEASIGSTSSEGADLFYFNVCTPAWLTQELSRKPHVFGATRIVVEKLDWKTVESAINDLIAQIRAETWEDAARQLGRYGSWEFEGMKKPFGRE